MYIFKNAWKSITRTKGRNILIGIIVVAIAASSCIALSIRNSASKLVDSYQESTDVTATLGMDREKMRSDMQEQSGNPQDMMSKIPALTIAQIESYGSSKYVKSYYYTYTTSLNSSNVTAVSNDSTESSHWGGGDRPGGNEASFRLIGYSSLESMSNFIEGTYKITKGAMFEEGDTANNCVITDELAEANDLAVGDTITFTNPNDATITYSFKVVGIYTDTTTDDENMNFFSNAANQIITNATAVANIVTSSSSDSDTALRGQINPTFNLTSSDDVTKFKEDLTDKGLSEYYAVNTNLDQVDQQLQPINNLKTFATTFLVLVLIIGGVILFILNMINIRERKYEIGVLRTIGMKKYKVLAQFISELFAVTFISLIIGTGIGSFLSVPTANSLLNSEIKSQQSEQEQVGQNFGRPGMSINFGNKSLVNQKANYIDKINATVNGTVLMQIGIIGLVLTVFSGSVAMIFISRYTPLRILSERT